MSKTLPPIRRRCPPPAITFVPLLVLLLALAGALPGRPALAQERHTAEQIRRDIERHRAMAGAHEAAARCLEAKQPYDSCLAQLQAACKGLGIGKHCGMKHAH
jgi:hypothetical protein